VAVRATQLRTTAVGTRAVGAVARGARWRAGGVRPSGGGHEGQDGAVGTLARGPNNAFNARELRSVWQPRGNGALPSGPGAARGV
jgi:hypothetical protein